MSLKQIIKMQKLLSSGAIDAELVLPGEPMIYSIKYSIGDRTRSVQFFRNEKWKSLLKCHFPSYYRTSIPVFLSVRFYVTPPESVSIKQSELIKECVPAVRSFEICDYLLSFLEMLHHVLINSYRQVVKIETEKFYSANPRTVFKFIKWDHYVNLQNNNSVHSAGKSIGPDRKVRLLQSELQGDAKNSGVCQEINTEPTTTVNEGTATSHRALQDTGTSKPSKKKESASESAAACKEARRRQPRKVSQ